MSREVKGSSTTASTNVSEYAPSLIKFQPLKNKIYLLTWQQFGYEKQKLMTKAMCLRQANDPNFPAVLRAVLTEAFKEGIIE